MDKALILRKTAGTVALAFIVHVVFNSVGSDYDLALFYWLLYCFGCALIINYENTNIHIQMALLALPSPIAIVAATYYRGLFRGLDGCYLSGIACTLDVTFAIKCLFFIMASVFFVWLFSYLSESILCFINWIFKLSPAKAKEIRGRVVWIGSILVAFIGVVEIFVHGWRR